MAVTLRDPRFLCKSHIAVFGPTWQNAVIRRDNTLRVIRGDHVAVISLRPSRDEDQLKHHRETPRIAVIRDDY
ncbi:hypothetical protein DPMN_013442 [Dreissena polymorpha]|uniref:Uncharacterized protein n=1 Tax=Dreissena polymorpha TaxID=45954 RepID=A0A9D4N7P2_DREPO|nr:hypothetical protein DPMN_013442 [Dreissena polymorpha]